MDQMMGLMGCVCLLPALPSALHFGRPHPEFAEPSRKISIDITAIWSRPRITRQGFALQIAFLKCPGRSSGCSFSVPAEEPELEPSPSLPWARLSAHPAGARTGTALPAVELLTGSTEVCFNSHFPWFQLLQGFFLVCWSLSIYRGA